MMNKDLPNSLRPCTCSASRRMIFRCLSTPRRRALDGRAARQDGHRPARRAGHGPCPSSTRSHIRSAGPAAATAGFHGLPGGLHLYAPDLEALPCLALAAAGARAPAAPRRQVMNAANEVTVHLFLDHKIGYQIPFMRAWRRRWMPSHRPQRRIWTSSARPIRGGPRVRSGRIPFLKEGHLRSISARDSACFGVLIAVHEAPPLPQMAKAYWGACG